MIVQANEDPGSSYLEATPRGRGSKRAKAEAAGAPWGSRMEEHLLQRVGRLRFMMCVSSGEIMLNVGG